MNKFCRLFCGVTSFLAATLPATAMATSDQPNVLLIIADDLGADMISIYVDAGIPAVYPQDYTVPHTPNIESLAASGVVFTKAWATPSCTPTRATLMTGQHGFRTGDNWPIGAFTPFGGPSQLDVDNPYLLPKLMQQAGYATALTGKWHMTVRSPDALDDPAQAGFDNSWGPAGGAVPDFFNWTQLVNETDPLTGDITVQQRNIQNYATTEDVDRIIGWIDDQAVPSGKPWFVWGAFVAPHLPAFQQGHYPPADLLPANRTDFTGDDDCSGPLGNLPQNASDQLIRNCYEAGMEAFDAEIGRLLNELELRGELENTVVIFVGDNGTDQPAVLDPVVVDHSKGTLYEQGVHVPFIVKGPDTAPFSRMTDNLVHTVDLFNTILDLAGTPNAVPNSVPLDSVSFEHMLRSNGKNSRKTNFTQTCVPYAAPNWALNPAFFLEPPHDGQAITSKDYKLIDRTLLDDNAEPILNIYGEEQRVVEFYDLEGDPYEKTNLLETEMSGKERAKFKKLQKDLDKLTDGVSCAEWRTEVFGD